MTGMYSVDITVIQEFVPTAKRGWLTGLTTTMLPAGFLLGALLSAFATPYIGWRGLFAVGLLPALLTLYIRAWVPGIAVLADAHGTLRGSAPVARLGIANRPQRHRPADGERLRSSTRAGPSCSNIRAASSPAASPASARPAASRWRCGR